MNDGRELMVVFDWLEYLRARCGMQFSEMRFSESSEWSTDGQVIRHQTGGFFTIEGVKGRAAMAGFDGWSQPIINQPEVGILGFLAADFDGETHFLVQGKAEPGNINGVQFAPTVQATFSNYTRKHGGAPTQYLEYFTDPAVDLISDSLQSEQGTRFFRKFNRNATTLVDANMLSHGLHFDWVSAATMRRALQADYTVNTDARSVLVSGPWKLLAKDEAPFDNKNAEKAFLGRANASYADRTPGDIEREALTKLAELRAEIQLDAQLIGLDELDGWTFDDDKVEASDNNGALTVKHYRVCAPEREKAEWDQPLVLSTDKDDILLICQVREGILKFLLYPSFEVGLSGGVEFGPSFKKEGLIPPPNWLKDLVGGDTLRPVVSINQSDEGGRFMHACSTYRVAEAPEEPQADQDCGHGMWVTLGELEVLCRAPGVLTNEARSVVSLLLGFA